MELWLGNMAFGVEEKAWRRVSSARGGNKVMLRFTATWKQSCHMLDPELAQASRASPIPLAIGTGTSGGH
jgi:hypothetical protein